MYKPQNTANFLFAIVSYGYQTFQPSNSYQKFTIPTQTIGSNIAFDTLLMYIYYLSKDKSANPSGYLLVDDLGTEGTLSVENTVIKKDFKIFPNPTTSFIEIQGTKPNSTYEITDLAGRSLLNGPIQNEPINVSTLITGLYFLRVSTKGESWVEKLQIQR